jgi:hypothetical protein
MCTLATVQATVTINVDSDGPGTITKASVTPFITMTTNYMESEDLTAVPDAGAVFSHWEISSSGLNYWSGNSTTTAISVYATTDGSSYNLTAYFENQPVDITIVSQTSTGITVGDPTPTYGLTSSPEGTVLYAGVNSPYSGNTGIRYSCSGFTGTGDFLITSPNTNTTITITQNSTITWNWDTEFLFTLNTVNGGTSTVDVSPAGKTWYEDGETIVLTAQPRAGYDFVRWDNPGGPVDGLTILTVSFNISAPQNIAAVFEPIPDLNLNIISKNIDGADIQGYSCISGTNGYNDYHSYIDINVNSLMLTGNDNVREHCLGYTSSVGDILPTSISGSEISGFEFNITSDTSITLDWKREYKIDLGLIGSNETNAFDVSFSSHSPQREFTSPPWFQAGDIVTITATSLRKGYFFLKWSNAAFGIDQYSATNTFVVTGAANIRALFRCIYIDYDLDGIEDDWENQIINYNTNDTIQTIEDVLPDDDFDGDKLSNLNEFINETDPCNQDSDGDLLTDYLEVVVFKTNPNTADTDGDDLSDYDEILLYNTDPSDYDTDDDGWSDGEEITMGTDPLTYDDDINADGIPNQWEKEFFGTNHVLALDDSDQDGQNNINEYISGTNPTNKLSYFGVTNLNDTIQDGYIITWTSVEGRQYDILMTHDLKNNLFDILETNIFYPSGCYTDLVHWTEEATFYKVQVKIIE